MVIRVGVQKHPQDKTRFMMELRVFHKGDIITTWLGKETGLTRKEVQAAFLQAVDQSKAAVDQS